MGSSSSAMSSVPVEDSPYMCIFFRKPNKIRLVNAPSLVDVVRSTITSVNPFGIKKEKNVCGAHTFNLDVCLFSTSFPLVLDIEFRRLLCRLLTVLSGRGFTLVTTSNVSREGDVSAWFFRRDEVERPAQQAVCLGLIGHDSLMVINGENEPQLNELLLDEICSSYVPGVETAMTKTVTDVGSTVVYVLNGRPWKSVGLFRQHGLWLLLRVISQFQQSGFDYIGRVNCKKSPDSFFFARSMQPFKIDALAIPCPQRFLLCLEKLDRIHLIGATKPVVLAALLAVILHHYPAQPQQNNNMTDDLHVWEFELMGYPWWPTTAKDHVISRLLILRILECLCEHGWRVNMTMETTRKPGKKSKSAFVMESCRPCSMEFICLSLNSTDLIRLINADQNLANEVDQVIKTNWPVGIQEQRVVAGDVPEWKLGENPWHGEAHDSVFARALLCALLAMFERRGWTLVSSADITAQYRVNNDREKFPEFVDSWFLAKETTQSRLVDNCV